MAETPANLLELRRYLIGKHDAHAGEVLDTILRMGLRIVPREATQEMENAMFDAFAAIRGGEDNVYSAAIATSPFALQEDDK